MSRGRLENLSWQCSEDMVRVKCNLCGIFDEEFILSENGLRLVKCRCCGLVYVNPRPARKDLDRFYQTYFPSESQFLWQKQMSKIFRKEGWGAINDYFGCGSKEEVGSREKVKSEAGQIRDTLLDVGCGYGFFLQLMRRQGWQVEGIEPSASAAHYARAQLGLEIHQARMEDIGLDLGSRRFDVISLWYVLEHVDNPSLVVERIHNLLRPGGLVIIRVPNNNIRIDRLLSKLGKIVERFYLINPPRHLFDYTPVVLERLLGQAGLRTIKVINSLPRQSGNWLELARRWLWYAGSLFIYWLSRGSLITGSSMTLYATNR